MFLGLPIFPGVSEHNQLARIVEMLGPPPDFMVEHGANTAAYFRRSPSQQQAQQLRQQQQRPGASGLSRVRFRFLFLVQVCVACFLPRWQ